MHFQHEMQAYPKSRYPEARLIPASCCSVECNSVLRERWAVPRTGPRRGCEFADAGPLARGRGGVGTSVEVTAADAVCELDDTLRAAGIETGFAEVKDAVRDNETFRALYAVWRTDLLRDPRRSGERLSRDSSS
jgi:hypothetical protein